VFGAHAVRGDKFGYKVARGEWIRRFKEWLREDPTFELTTKHSSVIPPLHLRLFNRGFCNFRVKIEFVRENHKRKAFAFTNLSVVNHTTTLRFNVSKRISVRNVENENASVDSSEKNGRK
jgi:hypothetical protein